MFLTDRSKTCFGLQSSGYWLTYNTLPFGCKASPFVYQSLGLVATYNACSLGIPVIQYIDDRFVSTIVVKVSSSK